MALIPPRRIERDRFFLGGGGPVGGGAGTAPGVHTHLEADITDLKAYLQLAGGTLTGEVSFTNAKTRLTNVDPSLIWKQTGGAADEKTWRITARTNQLRFGTLNDAESVAGNQMVFNRSGTSPLRIDLYGAVRMLDAGAGTDHGEFSHDGTDFNLAMTNTTDYNITGLTSLVLGGAIAATAGRINIGADASSSLVIGEPSTLRGNSQDGSLVLHGEDSGAIVSFTISSTGANLAFSGASGAAQFAIPLEVNAGKTLRIRDTTNADWGLFSHDGTDFNLALTNTTDYNITGANLSLLNGDLFILGAGLGLRVLTDTGKVRVGLSGDGQFYHDGTNTFLLNNTGTMFLWNQANTAMRFYTNGLLRLDITNAGDAVFSGNLEANGVISAVSATPTFRWRETDAAADNREWDLVADAEQLKLRVLNDLFSANNVMTVDRTGNTVDLVNFLAPVQVSTFGVGVTPISVPTVTGSRGANAALASLLTALANYGLITDSSS